MLQHLTRSTYLLRTMSTQAHTTATAAPSNSNADPVESGVVDEITARLGASQAFVRRWPSGVYHRSDDEGCHTLTVHADSDVEAMAQAEMVLHDGRVAQQLCEWSRSPQRIHWQSETDAGCLVGLFPSKGDLLPALGVGEVSRWPGTSVERLNTVEEVFAHFQRRLTRGTDSWSKTDSDSARSLWSSLVPIDYVHVDSADEFDSATKPVFLVSRLPSGRRLALFSYSIET